MVIGGSKKEVIKNIQKNIENNDLNGKVEVNDPNLSDKEREDILNKFYQNKKQKITHFWKRKVAYFNVATVAWKLNPLITIDGLENIKDINGGAIITSNHFNPLDNMAIRKFIKECYHKNLFVVIQDTNLAMPGMVGFLMNNLDNLPLWKSPNYINKTFKPELQKIMDQNNYVLIYPEEEMWFNYRKPRPCKRGAYEFATLNNKPIISCFVEIIDTDEIDNEEFNEVKYVVHILKPIYPDKNKSVRENSKIMAKKDYEQKVEAYQKYYHQKLDYTFSYADIAGLKKD